MLGLQITRVPALKTKAGADPRAKVSSENDIKLINRTADLQLPLLTGVTPMKSLTMQN